MLEVPEDLCLDTGYVPDTSLSALDSKGPFSLPSSKSAPGEQDASLAGPHLQPTTRFNAFINVE